MTMTTGVPLIDICATNLPLDYTLSDVVEAFEKLGCVRSAKLMYITVEDHMIFTGEARISMELQQENENRMKSFDAITSRSQKETVLEILFFMIAACIGGTAGGMLWTAQGRYFAGNAKLYARASLKTLEDVNSEFAGIFAASYLGLECITKALATIIFLEAPGSAPFVIFTIYTAIAFLATFAVTRLDDLGDHGTWTFDKDVVVTNVYATGRLMVSDSRLSLLVPFQIAFGLASSFVPFYVFGTVIADSDSLGGTYVGLLSAIIVLTGAAIAVPAGWAAQRFGKPVMMTIGAVGLMATGLAFFFFSDDQLGTWGMIIPYLIIYGIGRGTWENTNKAVVADYFGGSAETNTAAFAGIAFTSGLAGAFGYFAFNSMTRIQIAIMVFVSAVGALFAYYGSVAIHSNAKKSQQEV